MNSRQTIRIRPLLERLGLILFGLGLGILLLEVALRLGSLFFGPRMIENSVEASGHTILCLGDSHTYGVYYPPGKVYPGQLQVQLDRRAPNRYRVLNLGVPGMNSSQIRAKLPSWFDEYRPQTIIVGAGLNNFWNISATQQSENDGALVRAMRSLRVYRLYRLLVAAIGDTRSSPEAFIERPKDHYVVHEDGGRDHYDARTGEILARHLGNPRDRFSSNHARNMLWGDLETIHRLANERGVRLILLTYSSFPLPDRPRSFKSNQLLNDAIRRFSRERQVDLVDVRDRFLSLLSGDVPRAEFFANEREGHPNPRGYAEIAALVADVVTGSEPQTPSSATPSEPARIEILGGPESLK